MIDERAVPRAFERELRAARERVDGGHDIDALAERAAHRVALMLGHDHVRDAQRGVVLDRAIDGRADRAEADHRDVDGSVSVTHTGAPRACPS
ncbi:hypothetical protein Y030_3186 [Burkholderia pseudomallei MSHR332]|nr:hypothetical protein Y030_3186 [Burkholderia pseudomallei MSHR332]